MGILPRPTSLCILLSASLLSSVVLAAQEQEERLVVQWYVDYTPPDKIPKGSNLLTGYSRHWTLKLPETIVIRRCNVRAPLGSESMVPSDTQLQRDDIYWEEPDRYPSFWLTHFPSGLYCKAAGKRFYWRFGVLSNASGKKMRLYFDKLELPSEKSELWHYPVQSTDPYSLFENK